MRAVAGCGGSGSWKSEKKQYCPGIKCFFGDDAGKLSVGHYFSLLVNPFV